jgi:hypothetical protein
VSPPLPRTYVDGGRTQILVAPCHGDLSAPIRTFRYAIIGRLGSGELVTRLSDRAVPLACCVPFRPQRYAWSNTLQASMPPARFILQKLPTVPERRSSPAASEPAHLQRGINAEPCAQVGEAVNVSLEDHQELDMVSTFLCKSVEPQLPADPTRSRLIKGKAELADHTPAVLTN